MKYLQQVQLRLELHGARSQADIENGKAKAALAEVEGALKAASKNEDDVRNFLERVQASITTPSAVEKLQLAKAALYTIAKAFTILQQYHNEIHNKACEVDQTRGYISDIPKKVATVQQGREEGARCIGVMATLNGEIASALTEAKKQVSQVSIESDNAINFLNEALNHQIIKKTEEEEEFKQGSEGLPSPLSINHSYTNKSISGGTEQSQTPSDNRSNRNIRPLQFSQGSRVQTTNNLETQSASEEYWRTKEQILREVAGQAGYNDFEALLNGYISWGRDVGLNTPAYVLDGRNTYSQRNTRDIAIDIGIRNFSACHERVRALVQRTLLSVSQTNQNISGGATQSQTSLNESSSRNILPLRFSQGRGVQTTNHSETQSASKEKFNSFDLANAGISGDLETVKKLLNQGADINSVDEWGSSTVMTNALMNKQPEIINFILFFQDDYKITVSDQQELEELLTEETYDEKSLEVLDLIKLAITAGKLPEFNIPAKDTVAKIY